MTSLLTGIQWLNVIGLAAILVAAAALYRKWYETRYMLIPPVLWAAYGIVFYVLVLLTDFMSPEAVLLWGAIHRLLAVAMIFGGLVTLWTILDDDDDDGGDNGF